MEMVEGTTVTDCPESGCTQQLVVNEPSSPAVLDLLGSYLGTHLFVHHGWPVQRCLQNLKVRRW